MDLAVRKHGLNPSSETFAQLEAGRSITLDALSGLIAPKRVSVVGSQQQQSTMNKSAIPHYDDAEFSGAV